MMNAQNRLDSKPRPGTQKTTLPETPNCQFERATPCSRSSRVRSASLHSPVRLRIREDVIQRCSWGGCAGCFKKAGVLSSCAIFL